MLVYTIWVAAYYLKLTLVEKKELTRGIHLCINNIIIATYDYLYRMEMRILPYTGP